MNILLNHPSLIHHKEIKQICNPLNKFDISYFSHVHLNDQDEFSVIGNNPAFIELYFKNEYYNVDIHTIQNANTLGSCVIWDNIPRNGRTLKMGHAAAELDILHTFTIIEKNNSGCDYFHFSTHVDNTMMNQFYLSNLNLLKRFIRYFTEKVNHSSKLSKFRELIIEVDRDAEGYSINNISNLFSEEKNHQFLTSLQSNHDYVSELTKREIECLKILVRGKTAREIGEILGITRRTVEFYLSNIKSKLYVSSKSELIEKTIDLFD